MTRRPVAAASAVILAATLGAGAPEPAPASAERARPAVVEKRVIGHSVEGRPIRAWRLGDPDARVTAVAVASLHGDEAAPRRILEQLRDGRAIHGVDLWVVPKVNPDGFARGTRKNAHGVDLNRNFPRAWVALDGAVESGQRPASEPETRALMRLLRRVDPRFVVSFHQPLHGVDTWRAKNRRIIRRLSENLRLPRKAFPCGGTCHGTLTQWFNHGFDGAAVTVEYGARPSRKRMSVRAPRQLLWALGGSR